MDSYAASLAGGSSGVVIKEGNASGSRLFALLMHAEQPFMPPDQDVIPKAQLELVKIWIEQGLPENSGSKIKRSNAAAAAMLASSTIGKPEGPPAMPASLLRESVMPTRRPAAIAAMAASPWAPLIAVGGQKQVSFYHAQTAEFLGVIPFPEGEPQSLTFTRDGKQLLIGGGRHSHSGCAVLVDITTGNRIAKVGDELDIVLAADISPDKKHIAVAGPQKIIRVFDTFSGEVQFELRKHTDWIFALRYSPDGVLLASGDRSNGLIVWEAETGLPYSELNTHKGEVRSLDFRSDSNVLASGSLDGTIKLWDMFESKEIKSWNAHKGGVTAVAYAQNGLIASAGRDAGIKLWNGNGEIQKEFQGLNEAALEVALTGDAGIIAGGDWNGRVQVWSAEDPAQVKLIAANPPSIEQRLAEATERLLALQTDLDKSDPMAQRAITRADEAEATVELTRQKTVAFNEKLNATQMQKASTAERLSVQEAKITQLEQQLAAAKQTRKQLSSQLEQLTATLGPLPPQIQAATDLLASEQEQASELATKAQTAKLQREELGRKLTAAQADLELAVADKASLEARFDQLRQVSIQAANKLQALATQLTMIEEGHKRQQTALNDLEEKDTAVSQIARQLEAAEQAALEAEEELQLFQQAFPNK